MTINSSAVNSKKESVTIEEFNKAFSKYDATILTVEQLFALLTDDLRIALLEKEKVLGEGKDKTLSFWLVVAIKYMVVNQNNSAIKHLSKEIGGVFKEIPPDQRFELLNTKAENDETLCHWLIFNSHQL